MTERCPACHALVDDPTVPAGGLLRCGRCNTRFQKPKNAITAAATAGRDQAFIGKDHDLGIHPALAKRYAIPVPPKLGQPPSDATPAGAGTEPGRPSAHRRSMEGRVATPASPAIAAQPPPPKDDQAPAIAGYRMLEMIGKGAMGRVYRAEQLSTGRMAAIKLLAPELATRPDFVARFEREGAAMRAIKHPGVVTVWDQGAAGHDVYFIAMEFIDGHVMRQSLERGPLPLAHALRFARLILQALAAAHVPGVVHRDLKPENILVTGTPGIERLVLVDFGLAGMTEEDLDPHPNLTKSRMTMGTVNYMAPEQRTDAKRVDHRADIYSAGVMLYEMLTGDLPLGRFALPTERGLPVPASIDRIIVKALARTADERYQHALHFDAELAAVEAELRRAVPQQDGTRHEVQAVQAVDVPATGWINDNNTAVPTDVMPKPHQRSDTQATHIDALPSQLLPAPSGVPASVIDSLVGGPAWATSLPAIRQKTLWSASAVVVGLFLGLMVLRSGCLG